VPAFDSSDNSVRVFSPEEGFGFSIVLGEEAVDGGLQIGKGAKDAALEPPLAEFCEEPVHGMEPSMRLG